MSGRIIRDAMALGITGGIVGIYAYMAMSPRKQHEVEKSMKKTANELRSLTADISKSIRTMM